MERFAAKLKKGLTAVFLLLLVLGGVFLFHAWRGGHFHSVESLRSYLASFGVLGPAVLTAIQALQVVVPVLPGFLGCLVGAVLFGPAGGFWCNYIGICAGSIAAYFLALKYGVPLVEQLFPEKHYRSFVGWVNKHRSYDLLFFLCILLPLGPDDFLCYFSGLVKMSARRFIWIILLAKPWCILVYSLLPGWFLP